MSTASMRTRRSGYARIRAFTLIEVLVVVAIIALLISILLPSLRQARDVSKMMVCQSHLKETGHAMSMYSVDFKDNLPGPLHPLYLKYPQNMSRTNDAAIDKFIWEGYLNTRLRRYFSEATYGKGGTATAVGTCPAYPVPDDAFGAIAYNYALNNSAITAPNYYFGFTHGGVSSWNQWLGDYGNRHPKWWPKKMSRIFRGGLSPSSEWLLADAFRRPLPRGTPWPEENEKGHDIFPAPDDPGSTKQNAEWGSLSPNVQVQTSDAASGRAAPHSPFHPNVGSCGFRKVQMGGATGGTATRFFGKVNTLYFDMHVEGQNGWKGTCVPSADPRFKQRLD